MKSVDIKTPSRPYTFQEQNVLNAFFLGLVITIRGEEYRYAKKDDPVYEVEKADGVYEVQALESGIFKKMYEFEGNVEAYTPENASGFRYVIYSTDLGAIMNLIQSMTDEEKIAALADKALTEMYLEKVEAREKHMRQKDKLAGSDFYTS